MEAMTEASVQKIESTLGVVLPTDYRAFLKQSPRPEIPDDTSVYSHPDMVIEATLEYRQGFAGLRAWPTNWVCFGDEADACPYAVDCASGRVLRTNKGHFDSRPLEEWNAFSAFVAERQRAWSEEVSPEEQRRNERFYHRPIIVALVVWFVVLPVIAFGISRLYKWIFG